MKKIVSKVMTALVLVLVTLQSWPLTALGAIDLTAYTLGLKQALYQKLTEEVSKPYRLMNSLQEINAAHFRKSRYAYSCQLDYGGKKEKLQKLQDAYAKIVYGTGELLLRPFKLDALIYNSTYSEIPRKDSTFNHSAGDSLLNNSTTNSILKYSSGSSLLNSSSLLNNGALNSSTLNNGSISGSLLKIAPFDVVKKKTMVF